MIGSPKGLDRLDGEDLPTVRTVLLVLLELEATNQSIHELKNLSIDRLTYIVD